MGNGLGLTRWQKALAALCLLLAFGVAVAVGLLQGGPRGPAASSAGQTLSGPQEEKYLASTFAMDTVVDQTAYGPAAQTATQQVNTALVAYEARLSMFTAGGDIANINAAAGAGGAEVQPETAELLRKTLALSAQSEGAFAVTIAPVTQAWGVTGDRPRVVSDAELQQLLPLVDDSAVEIEGNHVTLPRTGMALDLGGIAKGAACSLARQIYEENGVESALLNIGGNVYARGTKPDGSQFRIGFRDPEQDESSFIASFCLQDEVIAVSGGYNRFFEVDGQRFIHIFDPRTGKPAESDILSVGVIDPDGATADFYSTTLYVWGKERALRFMENGGKALLLDGEGNLYVSESLRESFRLQEDSYNVIFVAGG